MSVGSGLPLPPESPEECETESAATSTAKSATCSTTSTSGGPQSGIRRPTPPLTGGTTATSAAELPGVTEYLGTMQSAAETQLPGFRKPGRTGVREGKPVIPMTPKGLEIAGRMKELFYAYDNRRSADNRSAQATVGPSEIGTPCDRRLAMSLLRIPPVNPGGDGWAAFVGTCGHVGLADMLEWANAGSGRYQTEVPLTFPSLNVPHGTTDVVDTTLLVAGDHKFMGSWSLNKLKTEGPGRTYRVQIHTYAYGAKLKGFDIKDVAIIGWPRVESSLDDLYVWTEPYNPTLARESLDRVDRIAKSIATAIDPEHAELPYTFPIDSSDCRYCPFHLKGAGKSEGGVCNGRD